MIRSILLTLFFSFVFGSSLIAQSGQNTEIQFVTLGNCAICKIRIEAKLSRTEGVISADWDYNNDVTTVVYDNEVTDAFQVMHAIADTGHDTEWYPAPDSMYALLIGSCCEYERTINYSNVQIGYLSLMGLWVYPVGVSAPPHQASVALFPSVGSGMITIDIDPEIKEADLLLTVYSLNGREAYHSLIRRGNGNRVDLSSLANGQYLAIVGTGKEIVFKSKLIITH